MDSDAAAFVSGFLSDTNARKLHFLILHQEEAPARRLRSDIDIKARQPEIRTLINRSLYRVMPETQHHRAIRAAALRRVVNEPRLHSIEDVERFVTDFLRIRFVAAEPIAPSTNIVLQRYAQQQAAWPLMWSLLDPSRFRSHNVRRAMKFIYQSLQMPMFMIGWMLRSEHVFIHEEIEILDGEQKSIEAEMRRVQGAATHAWQAVPLVVDLDGTRRESHANILMLQQDASTGGWNGWLIEPHAVRYEHVWRSVHTIVRHVFGCDLQFFMPSLSTVVLQSGECMCQSWVFLIMQIFTARAFSGNVAAAQRFIERLVCPMAALQSMAIHLFVNRDKHQHAVNAKFLAMMEEQVDKVATTSHLAISPFEDPTKRLIVTRRRAIAIHPRRFAEVFQWLAPVFMLTEEEETQQRVNVMRIASRPRRRRRRRRHHGGDDAGAGAGAASRKRVRDVEAGEGREPPSKQRHVSAMMEWVTSWLPG